MTEASTHPSSDTLQAYLEGELARERTGEVEAHLAGCRRCASELEAWQLLFGELDEVAGLEPSAGFADRVMRQVPTRPSLLGRLLERAAAAARGGAGRARHHLGQAEIQNLLDGALVRPRAWRARAHLDGCARCRAAVDEWRPLFDSLHALPRMAPRAGFSDRVMEGLEPARSRVPAPARRPVLAAAGRRLVPATPVGWALAAFVASLPTLGIVGAAGAVVAHPLLTLEALAAFLRWRVVDALQLLGTRATEWVLGSPTLIGLWEATAGLAAAPGLALAVILAGWAVCVASAWVLYRNVIAPPTADRHA